MVGTRSTEWIERVLRSGRPVDLELRGHSMVPSFRDGDLLAIAPLSTVRRGDVVLARIGGRLVAHRVISVEGARALLRGDASPRIDTVPVEQLLGRVVDVRRRHGSLRTAWRRIRAAWPRR
jgi:phage repressor protein C with HTH and peptisase S24 domain